MKPKKKVKKFYSARYVRALKQLNETLRIQARFNLNLGKSIKQDFDAAVKRLDELKTEYENKYAVDLKAAIEAVKAEYAKKEAVLKHQLAQDMMEARAANGHPDYWDFSSLGGGKDEIGTAEIEAITRRFKNGYPAFRPGDDLIVRGEVVGMGSSLNTKKGSRTYIKIEHLQISVSSIEPINVAGKSTDQRLEKLYPLTATDAKAPERGSECSGCANTDAPEATVKEYEQSRMQATLAKL